MKLTPEGLQLILDGEVGGGREYYDRFCRHPIVPAPDRTESGITIGIGFDLGQNSKIAFQLAWEDRLPEEQIARLEKACRLRGSAAVAHLPNIRDIVIPWETALAQFLQRSVPLYFNLTRRVFPGVRNAPQCVQEALLSLVYNRGIGMDGDRRREMRTIRDLVADGKWDMIPDQIRSMKRLWPAVKGLRDRREQESVHIERGQL